MPFLLILVAFSTFGLADPVRGIMLVAQGLFYLTALLDRWVPQRSVFKRVSSPIRTFVVLMAAAFLATKIFFVPAQGLWKETKVQATVPPEHAAENRSADK